MSDHDTRRRFDEYLQRDSDLSRLYRRIERPEPPAELDRSVSEAVRRARSPTTLWTRWPISFAAAAVMVLSLGLLVRIVSEQALPPPNDAPPAQPAESTRQPHPAGASEPAPAVATDRAIPPDPLQGKVPATDASGLRRAGEPAKPATSQRLNEEVRAAGREVLREAQSSGGRVEHELDLPSAEEWLAEIHALQEAGRKAEAERELERFLLAYPNYPRENLVEF